jgi:hypothetical protein
MKAYLTILLFSIACIVNAQSNNHKIFRVTVGQCKYPTMATAANGDAIIAYQHLTSTSTSIAIQRIDLSGNTVWTKAYQPGTHLFVPVTMQATPDSGAVIALVDTISYSSVQLIKINSAGNIQWAKKMYSEFYSVYPIPLCALQDGNIFFAYPSHDSLLLKKVSAAGNIIWEKSYNNSSTSVILPSAIAYNNSSLFIGGYDNDSYTSFLIRTDTTGNILWQKSNAGDNSARLNLAASGNGVILSTVYSGITTANVKIASINQAGAVNWAKQLPLHNHKMTAISSNSIAFSQLESAIVKTVILDTLGAIKEVRSYHDSVASDDITVAAITGSGFWISSINNDRVWLMKADQAGNTDCFMQPDTASILSYSLSPIALGYSTDASATTLVNETYTLQSVSITDSGLCITSAVESSKRMEINIYPNPTDNKLVIELPGVADVAITDVFGRAVFDGSLSGNATINTSEWQPGVYFITIKDGNGLIYKGRILKL